MLGKTSRLLLSVTAIISFTILLGAVSPALTNSVTEFSPAAPMANADVNTVRSVSNGLWSNREVWDTRIPIAGDNIVISHGTTVTYNLVSSPTLGNIEVEGTILFPREQSTSITFANMTIHSYGYVEAGTKENPIPSDVKTVIQLAAKKEGASLIMMHGHLEIHGAPVEQTFTKLDGTAEKGTFTITLVESVPWSKGDRIVITSTSLNPFESEENVIASISGRKITLVQPLKYSHDGKPPAHGEVALLTRNVVVTSRDPKIHAQGIVFMLGKAGISYAEFRQLGGKGLLGQYPIHFHHARNLMDGTIIQGVSVWDSSNRFVTIHNTNGITVRDSVGYKAIGHGFFLEDGTEVNNNFLHNIAILTRPGTLRPDDSRAAGFWIQNPVNNITGNVAVSAHGNGFDLAFPERAPEVIPFNQQNVDESLPQRAFPRQLKIQAFEDNEAHSNRGAGVRLYRLNAVKHGGISWFKDIKLWRNSGVGMDITASQANITSPLFFGNKMGNMQVDASDMTIYRGTLLGELDGVQSNSRYSMSPFGLILMGIRVTIEDSVFQGHTPRGNLASADIINVPRGSQKVTASILNTELKSHRTIIFGYPLNGDSYIKVVNLKEATVDSFTLHRYDLNLGDECVLDTNYMAMRCPMLKPHD